MPDWAPEVRKRLSSVRLSPTREAEIVEELSLHLDDRRRDLVAGGAEPEVATQLALAEFRDADLLARHLVPLRQAGWKDPSPPPSRWSSLQGLLFDLRKVMRALCAVPGFTMVALLVLMLSIGATTAIVSVVDAVILSGLPFPDADRLVAVGEWNIKSGTTNAANEVAPQNFLDWRDRQDVFTGLARLATLASALNRTMDKSRRP